MVYKGRTPQAWVSPSGSVSPGPEVLGFFTSSEVLEEMNWWRGAGRGVGLSRTRMLGSRRADAELRFPHKLAGQANTSHVFLVPMEAQEGSDLPEVTSYEVQRAPVGRRGLWL